MSRPPSVPEVVPAAQHGAWRSFKLRQCSLHVAPVRIECQHQKTPDIELAVQMPRFQQPIGGTTWVLASMSLVQLGWTQPEANDDGPSTCLYDGGQPRGTPITACASVVIECK